MNVVLSTRLQQAFASMLQQCYDDTSDIPHIEYNGVAPDWDCIPFWGDSIGFNESSIAGVITALLQY